MLTINEVAQRVNVSIYTIDIWYQFKKKMPNHSLAKMLPNYTQAYPRSPRLWYEKDIPKLIQFKTSLPKGRGGVMGSITNKKERE